MDPERKDRREASWGCPVLKGRVVSGEGRAAFFTQLDWVRAQCLEKFGFTPFPGTLNVDISVEERPLLQRLKRSPTLELVPPDPGYCTGQALPAEVGGIRCVLILPAEDVRIHGAHILEIMAPCRLKDALGIHDGDGIELTLKPLSDAGQAAPGKG